MMSQCHRYCPITSEQVTPKYKNTHWQTRGMDSGKFQLSFVAGNDSLVIYSSLNFFNAFSGKNPIIGRQQYQYRNLNTQLSTFTRVHSVFK